MTRASNAAQVLNAVDNHGVALAILTDGLDRPKLRIQCECGWHDSCGEVIAFDAVARSVSGHWAATIEGMREDPFRRIAMFADGVSGQPCCVVLPRGGGMAGIEHPGCGTLADLSVELDAFYCRACEMSGRVSGAWCAEQIGRRSADR